MAVIETKLQHRIEVLAREHSNDGREGQSFWMQPGLVTLSVKIDGEYRPIPGIDGPIAFSNPSHRPFFFPARRPLDCPAAFAGFATGGRRFMKPANRLLVGIRPAVMPDPALSTIAVPASGKAGCAAGFWHFLILPFSALL